MKIRSIYIIGALKNWNVIKLGNDLRKAGFDDIEAGERQFTSLAKPR